jgi:hypothetical protein
MKAVSLTFGIAAAILRAGLGRIGTGLGGVSGGEGILKSESLSEELVLEIVGKDSTLRATERVRMGEFKMLPEEVDVTEGLLTTDLDFRFKTL